jgi:hypothetical protein
MINVDSLFENENKLKNLKMKAYEAILNRISILIKKRSELKQTDLFYDIPALINGFNLPINKEECALFIIKKLLNMNFQVKYIKYKSKGIIRLYISWGNFLKEYMYNTEKTRDNNRKLKNYFTNLNKKLLQDN